jgi:hypothetical protein
MPRKPAMPVTMLTRSAIELVKAAESSLEDSMIRCDKPGADFGEDLKKLKYLPLE